jgi:hypothetical protein
MKFSRNVAGYSLKDQMRNAVIREELNTFNLNNIQNKRFNWFHHVERMEPESIPKHLLYN